LSNRRNFDVLEARRLRAARLFAAGDLKQSGIARELHVSHCRVSPE